MLNWMKYVLFVEGNGEDFAEKLAKTVQQVFTKKNSVWAVWENGYPVVLLRAAIAFYDCKGLLVVHCSTAANEYIHRIAEEFSGIGKLKVELVKEDYALL